MVAMKAKDLLSVVRKSRYPLGAFLFVHRGLDFTVRREHGEIDDREAPDDDPQIRESRHVTGRRLCEGLRDYAVKEYGLMARTVLRRWNIRTSKDFGRIVFEMIESGLMHKTPNDCLDDFVGVYDFDDAFSPQIGLLENT